MTEATKFWAWDMVRVRPGRHKGVSHRFDLPVGSVHIITEVEPDGIRLAGQPSDLIYSPHRFELVNNLGGTTHSPTRKLYVAGSLRNPGIPALAANLRGYMPGVKVFDDWHAAGPTGDDEWKRYEKARGRNYVEALRHGYAAEHTFQYDKHHLDTSDGTLLAMPAGKSAFLELGYMVGQGKWTGILLDDPDRWDVMFKFVNCVSTELEELVASFSQHICQKAAPTRLLQQYRDDGDIDGIDWRLR